MTLMMATTVESLSDRGVLRYTLRESGGKQSLEAYKEQFGGRAHEEPEVVIRPRAARLDTYGQFGELIGLAARRGVLRAAPRRVDGSQPRRGSDSPPTAHLPTGRYGCLSGGLTYWVAVELHGPRQTVDARPSTFQTIAK